MPRTARIKSTSGIYHVMLRGINHQQNFEDRGDCEKFLSVLEDCKIASGFKLYGYCVMGNHVHLLIKEVEERLNQIFRRIGSRYVYWYNINSEGKRIVNPAVKQTYRYQLWSNSEVAAQSRERPLIT